ncbi:MAG: DUF4097 family beta strand repeat-containing protein [Ignavibacteriales bacterium]|nr:DUF4097 family beta strand repeat-containing protein [Ignavibacteriales bacterium]
MKHARMIWLVGVFTVCSFALALAQSAPADKVNVPLSDPSRPVMLKIGLISGSITVKGGTVKDVTVEARIRATEDDEEKAEKPRGLKLITNNSTSLTVEEDDNVVSVSTGMRGGSRTVDLTLRVPTNCSMHLSTVNDGNIEVENVNGDLEINCTNGYVKLTGISGSAVANALNEDITASFAKVNPQKSMSFSSLNGKIDVTFPSDVKAIVSMKSDQGEIYSDFDMKMLTEDVSPSSRVQDNKGKKGKFRISVEKTVRASINGGGQDIQLTNFNGDIYIRKGK